MQGRVICIGPQGAQVETTLRACLTATRQDQVREDAHQWIKQLRLVPFDGMSMRERFTYQQDSLWWFTELYLHKMRQLDTAVGTVLALESVRDAHSPSRMRITTPDPVVRTAALAFATSTGLSVEFDGPAPATQRPSWNGLLVGLTAHLSRLRPAPSRRPPAAGQVAAFIHTAFWRPSSPGDAPNQEHYIGPVLAALSDGGHDGLTCVGVGPRSHFRGRRWWDPITAADAGPRIVPIEQLAPRSRLRGAFDVWRRRQDLARDLVTGAGIRAAGVFRGYDLWPILKRELEEVARVQWPWSARAMDEAGAALDMLEPSVALTYAEAGGWGRALMLEARRRAIPSVGVQHGFIYRHWLNYRHEADEMQPQAHDRGFPRPDLTLLFDSYAASSLESAGQFPRSSLAITGSPRLDELAARVRAMAPDRGRLRRDFGVSAEGSLVVLAAKFAEIHEELPSLIAAVSALAAVHLVIKTHPAETGDGYRRLAAGTPRINVVESEGDLGALLASADALVTMNSTVALDGIVLGVPALVIGLPNNLSPFVEAGIMMGADRGSVLPSLQTLLYDLDARDQLRQRAASYAAAHQMASDGRAARRAADAILALAGR